MKVIVGLGNPGNKYQNTRHNLGFIIIDSLLSGLNISSKISKYSSHIYKYQTKDQEQILFCKPQTYMNSSGEALLQIQQEYKLSPNDFLIIYDDLNIEIEKFKFSKTKSSGGHNGIKSIIQSLNSSSFPRLRAGIGPREKATSIADYVLEEFSDLEMSKIKKALPEMLESIKEFMNGSTIDQLQNKYNSKIKWKLNDCQLLL